MAAETKMVKGVKTISYKGKPYVEVAERVHQIHEKDIPFEVLDSTFYEVAGRVICKVKVAVDGHIYHGQAEAKLFNAVPKSADETNPFECAETSAVGRALAFAGLGTVNGIASFDEIARSLPADDPALKEALNSRNGAQPSSQPVAAGATQSADRPSNTQRQTPSTKPATDNRPAGNQRSSNRQVAVPTIAALKKTLGESGLVDANGA